MRDSRHTAFVIAQRISTVRDADLILVLDEGIIAAQGTHATLLRDSPLYNDILGSQLIPDTRRTRRGRGLKPERTAKDAKTQRAQRKRRGRKMEGNFGTDSRRAWRISLLLLSFSSLRFFASLRLQSVCPVSPMSQAVRVATEAEEERARQRGATARRLVGEMAPVSGAHRDRLRLHRRRRGGAGGGAVADRPGDRPGASCAGTGPALTRTMLLLLGVYAVGALASRGQVFQVGAIGQRALASLRARLFEQLATPAAATSTAPRRRPDEPRHQRCGHASTSCSRRADAACWARSSA